ncbi:MAG TPA: hypothetical protein PLU30_24400 [Verrucomicrobiae bacterium]|nr:hypothetical protein [Verrucomicrobiae bacterium]
MQPPSILDVLARTDVPFVVIGGHAVNFHGYVRTTEDADAGFLDLYDFIPGFPDVPPSELFADSVPMGALRFVSLRWLRRLKERAARHRDLDDLENLPTA